MQPGELLLLQADEIDVTVDYLKGYLAAHPEVQQVKLPDADAADASIELAVPMRSRRRRDARRVAAGPQDRARPRRAGLRRLIAIL